MVGKGAQDTPRDGPPGVAQGVCCCGAHQECLLAMVTWATLDIEQPRGRGWIVVSQAVSVSHDSMAWDCSRDDIAFLFI